MLNALLLKCNLQSFSWKSVFASFSLHLLMLINFNMILLIIIFGLVVPTQKLSGNIRWWNEKKKKFSYDLNVA